MLKKSRSLRKTGADGVMIGRAAVEKPWIFAQIKEGLTEDSVKLRERVVLEHFDRTISFRGIMGRLCLGKIYMPILKG